MEKILIANQPKNIILVCSLAFFNTSKPFRKEKIKQRELELHRVYLTLPSGKKCY